MPQVDPPTHMSLSEMLNQTEWYKDSNGKFHRVADMSEGFRPVAAERLSRLALHMANDVFKDLYAYAMPQGEQAQWEVERGEAEAEHVTANLENAQRWMAQTPLCAALRGEEPYETWGPEDEVPQDGPPPMRKDEQQAVELVELDEAIERARSALRYLEDLRGRMTG